MNNNRNSGKSATPKLKLVRSGERRQSTADEIEALTALAATLCHEINNPLMTITAITEVLQKNYQYLPDTVLQKINNIALAANRIKRATEKLIEIDSLKYHTAAGNRMIKLDSDVDNDMNNPTLTDRELSKQQ